MTIHSAGIPIPAAPPAPVIRPRPAFIDNSATLSVRRTVHDPHVVILANEACPECDGEGYHEVEVPGGRWSTWQGGMWVPDERRVGCERCTETGVIEGRARCVRCGQLHPDMDPWGIRYDEPACECDPEDVLATAYEVDRMDGLLYRAALLALDAHAQHAEMLPAVHEVEWNVWCALVARHHAPYQRHYHRVNPWCAATVAIGVRDPIPVKVFTTVPKGV